MNQTRGFVIATLAMVSVIAPGCRDDSQLVYPITGKVIFTDGSPAMFGSIECRSETEVRVIARGRIQNDGTFQVKSFSNRNGLIEGWHQVTIFQVVGTPRGGGKKLQNKGHQIADKYGAYDSSDLRIEVKPDSDNHIELRLDSKQEASE